MIKFILIAGIWVNTQAITRLTQTKDLCAVVVSLGSWYRNSGNELLKDPRPCTEIIEEINK